VQTRNLLRRLPRVGRRVFYSVLIQLTFPTSPSPVDRMLLPGLNLNDPCKQGRQCFPPCQCMILTDPQFVVSGQNFSMNFLLLCIQSTVCCACVAFVKGLGIISFRDFDVQDAKRWFPISFLLVSVIYTGSKSLVSFTHRSGPRAPLTTPTAISQYPHLYHIQESHDYTDCTLLVNNATIPYLSLP